jgi:hypothetical protein
LTCFLRQSYRGTIDQAVDMFDKIIVRMQADTARELDEQMCQQRKTSKVALSSLMEAIQVLRKMNTEQHGQKKVMLPDDAPVDFIPKRLAPIVMDGGLPSRPAWECALMLKLQEELKSGNISVGNSKRFGRFDDYLLPQEQWAFRRETFFQRSGLPQETSCSKATGKSPSTADSIGEAR